MVKSIEIEWNITPVTVSNTPASGTQNTVTAPASVSGSTTGSVNVTIPAQPRTNVNTFPLSMVVNWSDMTNKVAKLVYSGGGATQVKVVRFFIAVNYDQITNVPVDTVTATVSGKSGNPADVMRDLIAVSGQSVHMPGYVQSRAWFAANSWLLAKSVTSPTDSLALLAQVSEQSMCHIFDTLGLKRMVRKLSTSGGVHDIDAGSLLSTVVYSWRARSITDMQVNYSGGVLAQSRTSNKWLAIGYRDNGKVEEFTIVDGGWIADQATALAFAVEYSRMESPAARRAELQLPYTFSDIEPGDIIRIDDGDFRVVDVVTADHWPKFRIEEIPK
jgi:hypothetical protein